MFKVMKFNLTNELIFETAYNYIQLVLFIVPSHIIYAILCNYCLSWPNNLFKI